MDENKQAFTFKRVKYGVGTYSVSEHSYICDEDSQWVPIMMQFATFLDESGYAGVYETLSVLLSEDL